MRSFIWTLGFGLFFALTARGQENLKFGFQLSPSFSHMRSTDPDIRAGGTNLGLKMGVMSEYYFRENYAFATGIGFFFNTGGSLLHQSAGQYWVRSGLDSLPAQARLKYNLQFIEIPLALKMQTREFGYVRYFLEPGMSLAINTRANGQVSGPGIADSDQTINIRKDVNALLLSLSIGAGATYSLNESLALTGGIFFQSGFTDVTDDSGTVLEAGKAPRREDARSSINAITIRVGIIF